VESTQAFMFYLVQYSLSNLNAFMLIIAMGYSLYGYVYKHNNTDNSKEKNKKNEDIKEINNSPIQLIDQLKGFYYINPLLSLSLAITLFSFAGIPPLVGFFGKQMVLSAAIDKGYIFMSLIAILTSVISAVYYLYIIKQIFFDKPEYYLHNSLKTFNTIGLIAENRLVIQKNRVFNDVFPTEVIIRMENIVMSSSLSLPISILTLIITLFMFVPEE